MNGVVENHRHDLCLRTSAGRTVGIDWNDGIMTVYNDGKGKDPKSDEVLGTISADIDDMEKLVATIRDGEDPVEDGWEDGCGNLCVAEGW